MRGISTFAPLLVAASLVFFCSAASVAAQSSDSSPKFGPKWKTLIGEWKGEDQSGTSSGACGFHLDLSDHVIVRTNRAVLRGDGGKVHDDLLVISPEMNENQARASYFDNEGHLIEYVATWSVDGSTLTFLSKAGTGPKFRLTYKKLNNDTLSVAFEMAPPGPASAFRLYTSGKIVRSVK